MKSRKRLTLLRHAKAVAPSPSLSDRERPLNGRGERDAPLMGHRLRDAGARPSLIMTSPAVRALQTARLVAQELGYPLEFLQREVELYLATAEEILRVVVRQDNAFSDVILCGHNPGLTDFANWMTGSRIDNVPTCGIVVMESPVSGWEDLRKGASLVSFDYPKRADDRESVT